jgi:hypothetical protein
MIRIAAWAIALFLAAHGVAHLVGCLVSWRLMTSPEVPYTTTLLGGRVDIGDMGRRAVGALWLAGAVVFVIAGLAFGLGRPSAPLLIAGAAAGSLLLCAIEWPQARVGVFVNVALLVVLPAIGWISWRHRTDDVWTRIERSAAPPRAPAVRPGDASVPPPVARYLSRAMPGGAPPVRVADLAQEAEFWIGNRWRPLRARQRFTVDPPSFVWDARITMAPFVPVYVRDSYRDGHGSMRAELLGLYPIVSQHDRPELDAGALHRYLAESVWLPWALMPSARVRWEPVSDRAARVFLADGRTGVSLEFRFDEKGDVSEIFTPERFAENNGRYTPEPWLVRCEEYAEFDGVRIPVACSVEWQLASGPLPYWRGRITSARYQY